MSLQLPPHCKLFTADASSMYTNIPTRTAITKISKWLKDNQEQFPDLPTKAVLKALILIMEWSFFHFGDTTWRQLKGTAMGAPPAPPYATIYFAILESILLRSFMDSLAVLQLYRRYIDDVFGIWHCRMEDNQLLWEGFQKAMKATMSTSCTGVPELFQSGGFLDMTITLNMTTNWSTTLYEKPTNCILHPIPLLSPTRPPVWSGVMATSLGSIHSALRRLTGSPGPSLLKRLLARGYQATTLGPFLKQTITRARAYTGPQPHNNKRDTWESSCCTWNTTPKDPIINRSPPASAGGLQLQSYKPLMPCQAMSGSHTRYGAPCEATCQWDWIGCIVAYSRTPNLGNLLSYRKVPELDGSPVITFLD
ncbi:Reverse transcriptase (RNA-dependent DNA polymerase) [Seminavis robusta]|uniref:Reverse transcriptase (RNA-dependent DNA polymerase) n=1 Tax=Seminavis robusta TaxID=568900 RepID=A0A9N8EWQ2_9STRA|nr:Reverse transcriptase (RNA-dependent DNA polymerase) [Seminavis robusta]|eukprot:Sro2545_g330820.1 Reverse transcriptase (RNA-dependent DNA polymerase) (365) ;mRNA; f:11731-12825